VCPWCWSFRKVGFCEVGMQSIVAIGVGLVERADFPDGTAGER
jgi:hypothetical protein